MIGANKRFFLVCEAGIPGQSDKTLRFLVEYDNTGTFLAAFVVHFAAK